MSVVGFDFGNESCIVAVARQRRHDVVLNDESKRETPAIVCVHDKQRFIGTAGAASTMMNPKISIIDIKRLIGRKFSDPELQRDLKSFPFTVTEGPDGYPLIHARYLGENMTFTPTQILVMVLSDLKGIAEKNLNGAVGDCCIGIPVYFTDIQRRAVLDAAKIAGLHPLRLIHETTATALAYGIYKTDLPENDQLNVAFVDIGHASMQVCIAGFKKGQLKILSHAFDRSLGGRDFDEALFQHFAAKFKEEYKIDVLQNATACLRLRDGCQKLKKVLSANPEAPLHIDCLMDEKDVCGFIKRDEFEQICIPILERAKRPLAKALGDAGLTIENVHVVEMVGSSSRVPSIIKILTDFFKKEPRRTMNASECVAKGCALECAILSPTFKVCDFRVIESFPFSIALSWKGSTPDAQNGATENQKSMIVFPKGSPIPSVKALTFYQSRTFSIDVKYDDISELQAPAKISTYTIGPFQSTTGERSKLKVKVCLNLHGMASVEAATLCEEEKLVEIPVSKETPQEANKMKTNEPSSYAVPPSSSETDVNMQDAKGTADASGAENGVPEPGDKPVQMEADNKNSGSLDSIEPGKYILEKEQSLFDSSILAEIDRTMKKHADNLLHVLDGVSARLTQLESRTRHLENSMDDLKISVGSNHESTEGEMKQLENILRERDGGNDCEYFQRVDGPSVIMDAAQLEEINKKLEELDTRISLLDEVVSEKLEAIERRVVDFGEKVKAIKQRVEEMVHEMKRKEVKYYSWKCWMVAAVVFVWYLVKFACY